MRLSADQVAQMMERISALVPSSFYVAMAGRESSFDPNNVTHETNGQDSIGLFQVNADEARQAGYAGADLKDPEVNGHVISYLMEHNLQTLATKYGFAAGSPPPDVWYYLATSHNAGLGRAEMWIDEQGGRLSWAETKNNHPTFVTIARGYADEIGNAARAGGAPGGWGGGGDDDSLTYLALAVVGGLVLWRYY